MEEDKRTRAERHCKHINDEQVRRMLLHKYLESEKVRYDLGETALYGWIEHDSANFRVWAENLPYNCIGCGHCSNIKSSKECPYPFLKERIEYLETLRKKDSQ